MPHSIPVPATSSQEPSSSKEEEEERGASTSMASAEGGETQLGDLPESCLAHAIALTSPRDACRFAAVSLTFRAAADSDHVWQRFLPEEHQDGRRPPVLLDDDGPSSSRRRANNNNAPAANNKQQARRKKDAYLGLCDRGVPVDGDAGCRVWLEKASGAKCYAVSARRVSLPWDDGELSWRWTTHPASRFGEVAELVDCTCLDIYGRLPAALLTPSTGYAAYLVYGTAEAGHRGLSYPDQETTVGVGGRVLERHSVCLRPDDAETRKFRGAAGGGPAEKGGGEEEPRRPTRRADGWWEMEMGRLSAASLLAGGGGEDVVASFEVLGWYLKRGLVVEGMEFRPLRS